MSRATYLAIALLMAGADAVACYATGHPYHAGCSVVLSACWPVTLPLVIVDVACLKVR